MAKKENEMKRLVEEIAELFEEAGSGINEDLTIQTREDCRELARELIARIGQAYASGEIRLPGEMGRMQYSSSYDSDPMGAFGFPDQGILIALRPEEGEMKKKAYRALIDGIVKILQEVYKAGREDKLPEEFASVYAQEIIASVGQAFIRGELKLPGEVGRDEVRCIIDNGMDEGLGLEDILMYDIKVGDKIIALRPEEEEKDAKGQT